MTDKVELPPEWYNGQTYTPADVAQLFNVSPMTVARWAKSGIIGYFRLPGGNRRYPECEVLRLMEGTEEPPPIVAQYLKQDTEAHHRKWRVSWHNGNEGRGEGA